MASGRLEERRRQLLRLRVEAILKERVLAAADATLGVEHEVDHGLAEGHDPYRVADRLFGAVARPGVGEEEAAEEVAT